MSTSEIDAHRRADVTWHRPSWRLGVRPGSEHWNDVFGLLHGAADKDPPQPAPPTGRAGEMMAVLGLTSVFTLDELKRRYKSLAKQHHPDLHGGDKDAEERLKQINEAYTYLMEQRLYV